MCKAFFLISADGHTPQDPVPVQSDEQIPVRTGVLAGQSGKLRIKILESQVHTQERFVFPEESAYRMDLFFFRGRLDGHLISH